MSATLTPPAEPVTVSAEDRNLFREQGFLGPFTLCSADEMDRLRPDIEAVIESAPPDHHSKGHNRHLDSRLLYDLSTHPNVIERMAGIYGDDLLLWRTNFFTKDPHSPSEIPWHQDFNYWPIEPPVVISAWLAIDRATTENSCVELIPGSHRKAIPHIKAESHMAFGEMAHPDHYDASKAIQMELEPGQFFLFNERTLHHSHPNNSDLRRMGLAIRVVLPVVRVLHWDSPAHGLQVIHGEDRLRYNDRYADVPEEG